jgi:hypothetical protein
MSDCCINFEVCNRETFPLVVDLDGTLIRTDMLVECLNRFLIQQPLHFYKPLFWILQGKSILKAKLAHSVDLDATALPYNAVLLDYLRAEKINGRYLVLATASHRVLAEQIGKYCLIKSLLRILRSI